MEQKIKRFSQLKVGITVLAGLIIFLFFIVVVGTEENLFSESYKLKVFTENTDGLTVGSPVMLGGIKAGSVESMDLYSSENKSGIDVTLKVQSKYRNMISESSVASVKTLGMLGDKYVDISISKKGCRTLNDFEYVPLKKSFSLDNLAGNIDKAVENFSGTLANIKSISDTVKSGKGTVGRLIYSGRPAAELEHLLASAASLADAVSSGKGALGKAVHDPQLYDRLNETAQNLNAFSSNLLNSKGTINKLMTDDTLYTYLKSVSKRFDSVLKKTTTADNTAGKLFCDESLYNDLNRLILKLNALVTDINDNPGKYVKVSVF